MTLVAPTPVVVDAGEHDELDPAAEREPTPRRPIPPLVGWLQFARLSLLMLSVLSVTVAAQILFVGDLQHSAAQKRLLDRYRVELATGTAPVGPTAVNGGPVLAMGDPVALLEIPVLGVREVVVEGSDSARLLDGPGHRRDTVLPGQRGTSIVLGRRASFGGPFSGLSRLAAGDEIIVTTGQGRFVFEVIGVRREGDPVPGPIGDSGARLVLATAAGTAFVPAGVLRVDADLRGEAVPGPQRLVTASTLPADETIMAGDTSSLWALAVWLLALTPMAMMTVWSWHRVGRARTWVIAVPPLLVVGLAASGEFVRLLPNVM